MKNNDEWNVLHKAAKGGSKEIIEKLLSLKLDIDSRNMSSSTPLMIAAEHGKFDAFFLLIEFGFEKQQAVEYVGYCSTGWKRVNS